MRTLEKTHLKFTMLSNSLCMCRVSTRVGGGIVDRCLFRFFFAATESDTRSETSDASIDYGWEKLGSVSWLKIRFAF